MSRFRDIRICAGSSIPSLTRAVADDLGTGLGGLECKTFSDGERRVQYEQTVRGVDLFLFQSTSTPVNDHLMELLLMIDSARRASAARITAVIPYLGYSRQDRKDRPRVPISAKLVANLIEEAGADRVLTMHLHADQIQGFYDIPVDHLYSTPLVVNYLNENYDDENSVVVAPDAGAADRSRALARRVDFDLAIIDKRRPEPNRSKVANIIGDVEGRNAIILDDMIDTAGTLTGAAEAIDQEGAKSVRAVATHPLFSEPAIERIEDSPLEDVTVCDTISLSDKASKSDKINVLSTAELISDAIRCIHEEQSIQELFV
ncbi:MAG: ribose-phosphate diphosphokinase [bacterium]